MSHIDQIFITTMKLSGLDFILAEMDPELWDKTCEKLHYLPVNYLRSMIEYQIEYRRADNCDIYNQSMILMHNMKACAVWPVSIAVNNDGQLSINGASELLLPPLFIEGLNQKSIKSITNRLLDVIESICNEFNQPFICFSGGFVNKIGVSDFHRRLLDRGAVENIEHQLYLDLKRPLIEITGGFRKSYKSLINQGERLWRVETITRIERAVWDEFRDLHQKVSGKSTRSIRTWDLHFDSINHGDAFLVTLRDSVCQLVGAGLFFTSRDEGHYAVAAYDRALFEMPIGHVAQLHAIREMIRRGVFWYELGLRRYKQEERQPTEKEQSISEFKQGFSSHLIPRYKVSLHL
jgi:FemAB family protein